MWFKFSWSIGLLLALFLSAGCGSSSSLEPIYDEFELDPGPKPKDNTIIGQQDPPIAEAPDDSLSENTPSGGGTDDGGDSGGDVQPHVVGKKCMVRLQQCKDHPQYGNGVLFKDPNKAAETDEEKCLYERPTKWNEFCNNNQDSEIYVRFVEILSDTSEKKKSSRAISSTGCRINLPNNHCPNYPDHRSGWSFYEYANRSQARCLNRAKEFSLWCGQPPGAVTQAQYYGESGSVKASLSYVQPEVIVPIYRFRKSIYNDQQHLIYQDHVFRAYQDVPGYEYEGFAFNVYRRPFGPCQTPVIAGWAVIDNLPYGTTGWGHSATKTWALTHNYSPISGDPILGYICSTKQPGDSIELFSIGSKALGGDQLLVGESERAHLLNAGGWGDHLGSGYSVGYTPPSH